VIDSLKLVKALIQEALARAGGPKYVPFMRICKGESIVLKDRSYEFAFALKYFVEHLLIINVVGPLVSALFTDIVDHLCLGNRSKFLKRVE